MHYVDEGEGVTLLMLHGNPSWSFLYRKMILRLRGDFRCVAPDFPGFGLTETPSGYGFTPREHSENIERFVDKLGLIDLTLVVQDWGGRTYPTPAATKVLSANGCTAVPQTPILDRRAPRPALRSRSPHTGSLPGPFLSVCTRAPSTVNASSRSRTPFDLAGSIATLRRTCSTSSGELRSIPDGIMRSQSNRTDVR